MNKSIDFDEIKLGVCYYPEHWDRALWQEDLVRMKECGISIIRIAEFAWNKFEPEDGKFTFDFWDSFMEVAAQENMKVIFCTPTATPPVWLTEKHPEVLNADIDGNLIYNGTRRHYNMNSEVYKKYTARLVEKLAEHYVGNKNIVGWQLDNEINCENDRYYSKADHDAFREYCKNKYKTLDAFNEAMGTIVWNQTYTSWDQVHLCRRTNTPYDTNPHMMLLEAHFVADTVYNYFKLQSDIIKKWQKKLGVENQFITTNGIFRYVDYHRLVGDVLDFICYDSYPAFAFETCLDPAKTNGFKDRNSSFNLTKIRSISSNFGIMEQQSGAGGWNFRMMMPMPKKGQMRLWTMQSIAHGADFVSYFRWRTARVGTEIYWHGLLDYDNRDNRRIAELKQIKDEVAALKNVAGSKVVKRVALLMDYDNEWDGAHDIWHGPLDRLSYDGWFRCLQESHIPHDFVYVNDETTYEEIKDYEAVIYPHPTIFSPARHHLLKTYIENGGKAVFGCRSGYKDQEGHCLDIPMPGHIADLTGCYVQEYTPLSAFDDEIKIVAGQNQAKASNFIDILEPISGGQVLGTFDGAQPAIIKKTTGKGYGMYVGTVFDKELAQMTLELIGVETDAAFATVPPEIEVVTRKNEKTGQAFTFLLNYDKNPVTFQFKGSQITLGAYDVKVL